MQEPIRKQNEILRFGVIRDRLEDASPHENVPYTESCGTCPVCGVESEIKTVRQRTQYQDDSLNWFTGCEACIEENSDYWDDMWSDYYLDLL